MFPHCEQFFRIYRLTGRAHAIVPPCSSNIIKSATSRENNTSNCILEEIAEVTEDLENKKDSNTSESVTKLNSDYKMRISGSLPSGSQGMPRSGGGSEDTNSRSL